MKKQLLSKLKKAKYPFKNVKEPDVEELIDMCGGEVHILFSDNKWLVDDGYDNESNYDYTFSQGESLKESLVNLYCKLYENKKYEKTNQKN